MLKQIVLSALCLSFVQYSTAGTIKTETKDHFSISLDGGVRKHTVFTHEKDSLQLTISPLFHAKSIEISENLPLKYDFAKAQSLSDDTVTHKIYLPSIQYIKMQSDGRTLKTIGLYSLGYGYDKKYRENRSWTISFQHKFTGFSRLQKPEPIKTDKGGVDFMGLGGLLKAISSMGDWFTTKMKITQYQLQLENNYHFKNDFVISAGASISYNKLQYIADTPYYYSEGKLYNQKIYTDKYFSLGLTAKASRKLTKLADIYLQFEPNMVNFTSYGTQFRFQPNITLGLTRRL